MGPSVLPAGSGKGSNKNFLLLQIAKNIDYDVLVARSLVKKKNTKNFTHALGLKDNLIITKKTLASCSVVYYQTRDVYNCMIDESPLFLRSVG